jgi:hypothetical protein
MAGVMHMPVCTDPFTDWILYPSLAHHHRANSSVRKDT